MQAHPPIEAAQLHGGSGTSFEPPTTPVPVLMTDRSGWLLMLHGTAFVGDTQQQAAKTQQADLGRDAFFSTNWAMLVAEHHVAPGILTQRTMLSLEPGTFPNRECPKLFQQGETAVGKPILERPTPHDLWRERRPQASPTSIPGSRSQLSLETQHPKPEA